MTTTQLLDDMELSLASGRNSERTAQEYRRMFEHFIAFLDGTTYTYETATADQVGWFVKHLMEPHGLFKRLVDTCPVCSNAASLGRDGRGYSASYAKRHLVALRAGYQFLLSYGYAARDPTAGVPAPKVTGGRQYVPSKEEVNRLLAYTGTPRSRLLVHLAYFVPARRAELARMRYCDIDENRVWKLTAKGGKPHAYAIHGAAWQALRAHRQWQQREARKHPAMAAALADPETAYVFLTRSGRPIEPGHLVRLLKRHAVHAGVGVIPARGREWGAINGMTSRLSPHALRRAWASHVLNGDRPVPLDVVSKALGHADVTTTQRHYAFTDDNRAYAALVNHRL